jgi:hypothetical protein
VGVWVDNWLTISVTLVHHFCFTKRPQINTFWKVLAKDIWNLRETSVDRFGVYRRLHFRWMLGSGRNTDTKELFLRSLCFKGNHPEQRGWCRAEWIMKNIIKTKSDRDLNYMQEKYFWGKWDGREGLGQIEEFITRTAHNLYHLILENSEVPWEGS